MVQHGEALAEAADATRPLSDRGWDDVRKLAGFLAARGLAARVVHSGKLRARQTAEVLAAAMEAPVEAIEGLDPGASTDDLADRVSRWDEDTMVVGHLPFLDRFVSRACAGHARGDMIAYRPGSLVCLERGEDGAFRLAWMVRPELL